MVNVDGVFELYREDEGDLGGLFMRLKNLLISETHTKWDIAYLETYIKNSIVPRSLRWEISPQKGETDLEEWFNYLNKAGVAFLRFLIDRKNVKLTKLDTEIKSIKDKLIPMKDSKEYKEKKSESFDFDFGKRG